MFENEFWQAILLGVVQGITEFLPISSDGHLTVLQLLLNGSTHPAGVQSEPLELILALHVGTLLSIIIVYWRDLRGLVWNPRLCGLILLATLPAAFVGLTFKQSIESTFNSPLIAGFGFWVTAGFLWIGQYLERDERELDTLRAGEALLIGVCQSFALLPGVSRSGSTIAAGLAAGLRREGAARFSFLIAVPAIAGASLLLAKDLVEQGGSTHSAAALIGGAVTSFLVGLVALRWLIRIVTQRRLHWFAWYCLAAGALTITWALLRMA